VTGVSIYAELTARPLQGVILLGLSGPERPRVRVPEVLPAINDNITRKVNCDILQKHIRALSITRHLQAHPLLDRRGRRGK